MHLDSSVIVPVRGHAETLIRKVKGHGLDINVQCKCVNVTLLYCHYFVGLLYICSVTAIILILKSLIWIC